MPKFFGIEKSDGDFFQQTWGLISHPGQTQGLTLLVGVLSLAVVLGCRRFFPLLPGSLLAVLLGTAASVLLDLQSRGVDIVGQIDSGLPSFGLPNVGGLPGYLDLAAPAVGVLIVGFAEGLGAAKTYAVKAGYQISPNRELVGLGAANLGSGLCAGMVVNGSLSKTAVNGGAGAKSQVSGLVVAVLTLLTMLFLTGLFEQLPEPGLSALVIAAVIELVDVPGLRRLYRVWTDRLGSIDGFAARADFAAAIAAMLGVLIFDTLPGLVIGIGVSMLLLLYRVARPHVAALAKQDGAWLDVERHDGLEPDPTRLVVQVESGLFFANSDHVRDRIDALRTPATRMVVLGAETSPFIDISAAEMLAELAGSLRRDGIELRIARDIGQFRDVMRGAVPEAFHHEVFRTIDQALQAPPEAPPAEGPAATTT